MAMTYTRFQQFLRDVGISPGDTEATNAKMAAAAAVTPIATADASDPATTQALANACKAKINELLAALAT
jgi:hypothetical protein